jgi:hypothetical protein
MEPLHGTAACVEDEFLLADFYQRARSETIQTRRRRSRSKQRNSERILCLFGHNVPLRYKNLSGRRRFV